MQRLQTSRNIIQEEVAALNHAGLDRCVGVSVRERERTREKERVCVFVWCVVQEEVAAFNHDGLDRCA